MFALQSVDLGLIIFLSCAKILKGCFTLPIFHCIVQHVGISSSCNASALVHDKNRHWHQDNRESACWVAKAYFVGKIIDKWRNDRSFKIELFLLRQLS